MTTFSVPDMNCGHCKASVESALAPIGRDIQVDLTKRQVTLTSDADNDAVMVALLEVGFAASVVANPA